MARTRQRSFTRARTVATVALLVVGITWAGAVPVHAEPGDGVITVIVSRDVSGDGAFDAAVDRPQAGILVRVSDAAGTTVDGITDAAGEVVVLPDAGLVGGRYLVETTVPAALSHLRLAPASASAGSDAFRSASTFVDVGGGTDQTVRVGVWNPADYAPLDPDYVLAIQASDNVPGSTRSLVISNWALRGDGNGAATTPNTQGVTTIATRAQTGSIFGTAWSSLRDRVFSAAFAKAFVQYGPGGPGAIYVTDPTTGSPNASTYVVIPDAGSAVHGATNTNRDDAFYAAAGAESLGGLAISDDDQTLYVVNLNDRRLYEVDASGPTGVIVGSTAITDPGCVGGVWRPGAVTVDDGDVYVGGICDASTSGARSDLRAYVMRLDAGTFSTVLEQPLDFLRGQAENGGTAVSRQWNPWRMTWSRAGVDGITVATPDGSNVNIKYPTPLLTTLDFDVEGSMFLGFRDRHSDQIGQSGLAPEAATGVLLNSISAGDLNKACVNPDGTFSWEGTGACPDNTLTVPDGGQAAGVVEFFAGDWVSLSGSTTSGNHHEVAQGGLAYAPRNGEVATNAMDPTGLLGTGGIGYFDTTTGQGPGGAPTARGWLVNTYPESFGKGNGLGDLALLAAAPVQVGNRVWHDLDRDGIQDPGELPVPGATVNLVDAGGTVVATTTTNSDGEYYFGGDGAAYALELGTDYTVRFDVGTADTSALPGAPLASRLQYTAPGAGGDPSRDSDPTPMGAGQLAEAAITTPTVPGAVDHTIDAGVYVPPSVSVGDYVWLDADRDGIQDADEDGIGGVVLVLTGPGGAPVTDVWGDPVGPTTTDGTGWYSFDDLPPLPLGEHYTVTIDRTASGSALAGLSSTLPGQGEDGTVDSSSDFAVSRDLVDDGDRDDTLDFGFVRPVPPVTSPAAPGLAVTGRALASGPFVVAALLLLGGGVLLLGRARSIAESRRARHL